MTLPARTVWIDAGHPYALKRLWGMTLLERIVRQFAEAGLRKFFVMFAQGDELKKNFRSDFWKRYPDIRVSFLHENSTSILSGVLTDSEDGVIAVEGNALYDERLTAKFASIETPAVAIDPTSHYPLLVFLNKKSMHTVKTAAVSSIKEWLTSCFERLDQLNITKMESYYRRLRSYQDVYWILVESEKDIKTADAFLKHSVHKGTNDIIAKFIHPRFEFALTRLICNTGIQPNHVTMFNIVLAFSAVPFFYIGHFGTALAMALTKGVTDGVDGKLARLTLRTSNFGDKLDHISDTIYLNCYYVAMALYFSKGEFTALPLLAMFWVIPTYFLDRLVRWLFMKRHNGETVQDYRQIDVWFRLVQSNRNISMWTLLTSYLFRHPIWGFYGIIFWTPSNFIYYGIRHIYEYNRTREGTGFKKLKPATVQTLYKN